MLQDIANIQCEHVESFIAHLLEKWKPTTANNRYLGVQSFLKGSKRRARSGTPR